jgi:hypothetical protein
MRTERIPSIYLFLGQDLLDHRDFFVFPHFPVESGSQQSPAGGEVFIYVRPG